MARILPFVLVIIPIFFSSISFSQQILLFDEYDAPISDINKVGYNFHEGVKPYYSSEINNFYNLDSLDKSRSLLFNNDTLQNNITTSILPIINLGFGYEQTKSSGTRFNSGAGILLNLQYKKKLHFNTFYSANLSKLPNYVNEYINLSGTVPQEGIAFYNGENIHSRNFGGYINYVASDIFNFELGHGKHHLGNGYRSLLLSDASNNYSYAKITTTIWKFKYVNLYTNFKDIEGAAQKPYWKNENKFGTFHYLSWNITKRINAGFFENVIWQAQDTLVNRGFDVNYLNPVIFYRPVEYAIGSSDNSLMGLNLRYKTSDNIQLYGQLILDEFLLSAVRSDIVVKIKQLLRKNIDSGTQYGWWANKQGYQLGIKWNNILGIKHLNTRIEYNTVRPYTYSHISGASNYGHYNQHLAHPFGANFKEAIWILNYQKNKLNLNTKTIYSLRGKDSEGSNYGGDIFKPYTTREQEYFNFTGQGIKSKMLFIDLKLSYIVIPKNMLHAFAGVRYRNEKLITQNINSIFFYIGIKTSLYNTYNDF